MGRTLPTFRQLIDQAIARWSKFRRALRREDQQHLDRLFLRVRLYTQAATYQCHDDPMDSILLAIALDQEKRLRALESRIAPGAPSADSADAAPGNPPALRASSGQNESSPAKKNADETPGMDLRSLPRPAGDDSVADHAGADAPPHR